MVSVIQPEPEARIRKIDNEYFCFGGVKLKKYTLTSTNEVVEGMAGVLNDVLTSIYQAYLIDSKVKYRNEKVFFRLRPIVSNLEKSCEDLDLSNCNFIFNNLHTSYKTLKGKIFGEDKDVSFDKPVVVCYTHDELLNIKDSTMYYLLNLIKSVNHTFVNDFIELFQKKIMFEVKRKSHFIADYNENNNGGEIEGHIRVFDLDYYL